jgi:hypothetical protein
MVYVIRYSKYWGAYFFDMIDNKGYALNCNIIGKREFEDLLRRIQ